MRIFPAGILHDLLKRSKTIVKSELALVLDVGSSSVGAALFEINRGGAPKITFSIREPILLEEKIDFDQFLSSTVKSLEIVTEKINKAALGTPKRIFCVLSSPWYASQTRVINYAKDTPFVFTEKLSKSLVEQEISLFEEEYLKKYVHPKDKIRSIEIKTIKTMLNGYETEKPFDKTAKEFQMTIFISISPEEVLSKIEQAVNKHFHLKEIKFSSFVMASFVVARDIFSTEENFLLIDLGGEVTDISMIKHNILRESISYPCGSNFMIRGVAESMKSSIEEARSLFSLYMDGHAVGSVAKTIEPVIAKLKAGWLEKFQESLAHISNDISIPSKIFLAVDKEFYNFFTDIIKTEQFNQYTLTDSKFEVVPLGTESLSGAATFKDNVLRDPFTIIPAIYINRFFH